MQITETRFIRIEGTHVAAAVDTADEAKLAVKELRHKKREFTHMKRALVRQRKAAEARAARAKRKRARPRGFLARTRAVIDFLAGLPGAFGRASAMMDLPKIEREIANTDDILHNLDTVMLQLEGKLLHKS